jgi:hypothetical protein
MKIDESLRQSSHANHGRNTANMEDINKLVELNNSLKLKAKNLELIRLIKINKSLN